MTRFTRVALTAVAVLLATSCSVGAERSDLAGEVADTPLIELAADEVRGESIVADAMELLDSRLVDDTRDADWADAGEAVEAVCVPSCAGKLCGDDGCGGSCGLCVDDNPCTDDECTAVGQCMHSYNTVACDDGNVCTVDDACFGGVCSGNLLPAEELVWLACLCLDDADCEPVDNHNVCDGALFCQTEDGAAEGVCLIDEETIPACDDGIDCTVDYCDPATGCQYLPDDAACEDGEPCSDDICDAESGCMHEWNEVPCDDGDICTELDVCDGQGLCVGQDKSEVPIEQGGCEDGNQCTLHLCGEDGSCSSSFSTGACDDGDPCTISDWCDGAGLCAGEDKSLLPLEDGGCEDDNSCTEHACNEQSGECVVIHVGWPCDDGDPCTLNDHCFKGECVSDIVNPDC